VKAPVRPSKIVGVGGNFAILRNYSGPDFWKFMKPDEPNTFCKAGNCVIGPDEPIVLPKQSNVILSEMELAVIISKPARHVDLESAYDYVAGYSVCFDMTAHDIVGKNIYYFTGKYAELGVGPGAERMYITPGLWVGKSIDTFAPMGPWIVTKDEVPEPGKLHMETKVNGEVLHSGINEMVSDIPHILRWITTWQTLLPGDAIFCGSLPPWKPIVPGDKLQATIEKVGVLTNPCVADPTA